MKKLREQFLRFFLLLLLGLGLSCLVYADYNLHVENAPELEKLIRTNYTGNDEVQISGNSKIEGMPVVYITHPVDKSVIKKIVLKKDTDLEEVKKLVTKYLPQDLEEKRFWFVGKKRKVKTEEQEEYEKNLFKELQLINASLDSPRYKAYECTEYEQKPLDRLLEFNREKEANSIGKDLADDLMDATSEIDFGHRYDDEYSNWKYFAAGLDRRVSEIKDENGVRTGKYLVQEKIKIGWDFYKIIDGIDITFVSPRIEKNVDLMYLRTHIVDLKDLAKLPAIDIAENDLKEGLFGQKPVSSIYGDFARTLKKRLILKKDFFKNIKGFAGSMVPSIKQIKTLKVGEEREFKISGKVGVGTYASQPTSLVPKLTVHGQAYSKGNIDIKIKKVSKDERKNTDISLTPEIVIGAEKGFAGHVFDGKVGVGPLKAKIRHLQVTPFENGSTKEGYLKQTYKYKIDPKTKDGEKALSYIKLGLLSNLNDLAAKSEDVDYVKKEKGDGVETVSISRSMLGRFIGIFLYNKKDKGKKTIFNSKGKEIAKKQYSEGRLYKRVFVLRNNETLTRTYSVETDYETGKSKEAFENVTVSIKNQYYDHLTHSKEIEGVYDEIKDKFGVNFHKGKLPERDARGKKINYGGTRITTELNLPAETVNKFLDKSDDEMWKEAEFAFGVKPGSWSNKKRRRKEFVLNGAKYLLKAPLTLVGYRTKKGTKYLKARKLIKSWQKARDTKKTRTKVSALGKIFGDNLYGPETMKLLRNTTANSPVELKINGGNKNLGEIDVHELASWENIKKNHADRAQESFPDAKLAKVKILDIDSKKDALYIYFSADRKPEFVHLKLKRLVFSDTFSTKRIKALGDGRYRIRIVKKEIVKTFYKKKYRKATISIADKNSNHSASDTVKLKGKGSFVVASR